MTQTFLFCFFLLLFNPGAMAASARDGPPTTPADLTPPGAEPAMTPAALKSRVPEALNTGSPGDGTATTEAKFVDRLLGTEKPKVPGADVKTTMSTNPGIVTTKKSIIHNKPVTGHPTSDTGPTDSTSSSVHDSTTKAPSIQTTPLPDAILHTTPATVAPDAGMPNTTFFTGSPEVGSTPKPVNCIKGLLKSILHASDSWSKLDVEDDGFLTPDWEMNVNRTTEAFYNMFVCGNKERQWLASQARKSTVSFS